MNKMLDLLIKEIQKNDIDYPHRYYYHHNRRLDDLKRCFNIKNNVTHEHFYTVLGKYISKYVKSLDRIAIKYELNAKYDPVMDFGRQWNGDLNVHIEFLKMLYKDNEELSIELMGRYPHAYSIVDEKWAQWLEIIK